MKIELALTRAGSVAGRIEQLVHVASNSIDAALYRFNHPRLARALRDAADRRVKVRVVLDRNKYEESRSTRELFANHAIPLRLLYGRQGVGTKMHHKFAILDGATVLTGSYNWTLESEEQNFESLLIVSEWEQIESYQKEFESLWAMAAPPG
jgi:cardiolipin hydrolase